MVSTARSTTPALELQFDRANKIYQPQETVQGTISLKNSDKQIPFEIVELEAEAYMDTVSLIRGNLGRPALPKEKRIYFMSKKVTVKENGLMFTNGDPLPFSFKLESTTGSPLIDSYVGVDFSIVYKITVTLKRRDGNKPIDGTASFDCRVPGGGVSTDLGRRNKPQDFSISADTLAADPKSGGKVLRFSFSGQIASVNCCFDEPFDGFLILHESEIKIKSIEIQLVRVETFEGKTNATEIQNIQVADGNVLPSLQIPLYMLFPNSYSCSTVVTPDFKIEFHINLIVIFHNGYQLTENFPIRIFR